jgi:hypothetical protein
MKPLAVHSSKSVDLALDIGAFLTRDHFCAGQGCDGRDDQGCHQDPAHRDELCSSHQVLRQQVRPHPAYPTFILERHLLLLQQAATSHCTSISR